MRKNSAVILHILEHIQVGGIRTKLLHMLKEYPDPDARHIIKTFDDVPALTAEFNELANVTLDCEAVPDVLSGTMRRLSITNAIGQHKPSVLHSWHMSTNVNMVPIIPFLEDLPSVLSIDCPSVVAAQKTPATIAALKKMTEISSTPHVLIHSISPKTTDELVQAGMPRERILELGNGVDVDYFRPVANAKQDVCSEFGLPEDVILIGGAGRHSEEDKSKDIPNVLYTAAALKEKNPGLYNKCAFMVCGKGTADGDLHDLAQSLGVEDKAFILGARHDMPRLYSAWTISNICSLYEPFGLVLPEAMACETVCVATNVDMLPQILSGHGLVVEPADAAARAAAWENILSMPQEHRAQMAAAARTHVERHYNARIVNTEYAALYSRLASQTVKPSPQVERNTGYGGAPLFGGLLFGKDGAMFSICP